MLELAKDTFEAEVLQAEGTVFVDFYGDGCVPCAALMPFVHEMADKYGDKIKFCALNDHQSSPAGDQLEGAGPATMAIFKGGEKVEEVVKDDATPENIEALIKKYL